MGTACRKVFAPRHRPAAHHCGKESCQCQQYDKHCLQHLDLNIWEDPADVIQYKDLASATIQCVSTKGACRQRHQAKAVLFFGGWAGTSRQVMLGILDHLYLRNCTADTMKLVGTSRTCYFLSPSTDSKVICWSFPTCSLEPSKLTRSLLPWAAIDKNKLRSCLKQHSTGSYARESATELQLPGSQSLASCLQASALPWLQSFD